MTARAWAAAAVALAAAGSAWAAASASDARGPSRHGGALAATPAAPGGGRPLGAEGAAGAASAAGLHPAARLPAAAQSNPPYDGRFAFVRLRYGEGGGGLRGFGGGFGRGRGREPVWAHDYPRAETNFLKILGETTYVGANLDGRVILDVDDPELFRYPVAYIVEVGFWSPTDEEVAALRSWLLKGGFLIVDDFRGGDIRNFEAQLRRVLPESSLVELPDDHEIFDSFFHIDDPHALLPPTFNQYPPIYLGVYEDGDPAKRLMVMVNYNQDMAEYWEFSDYGYYPIDLSNDAYKFGVNYVIYAYTH